MEIGTLLITAALILAAAALLARPFLNPGSAAADARIPRIKQRLLETGRMLEELREDLEAGKIEPQSCQSQEERLLAQRREYQDQLDALQADDPIEKAVAQERARLESRSDRETLGCPRCGEHLESWHRFCPSCGEALEKTGRDEL